MPTRMLPAFVGGFRSGGTLLVNLLGLHPAICAWFETRWLCEPLRWMKVLEGSSPADLESGLALPQGVPGFSADAVALRMRLDIEHTAAQVAGRLPSGKGRHERYPLGAHRIGYGPDPALGCVARWREHVGAAPRRHLASATAGLIERLSELQRGGRATALLVNKTPEIPRFGAELARCVGPLRMVNLVRDGREVAASAAGLGWGRPARMGQLWEGMIRQARAAARCAEVDYLEVRFEDLVERPARTTDEVLGFLGLPARGAALVREFEARTEKAIAPASAAHGPGARTPWRRMPASARELLVELGYAADPAWRRWPGRLSELLRRRAGGRPRRGPA